jgi:hypothetical protein
MIFISLLLYLPIVIILFLSGVVYLFSFPWYYFAIILILCMALVRVSFSLIRNFQDEFIPAIKDISKISGVRSVLFITAAVGYGLTVYLTTNNNLGPIYSALIVPVAIISTLNFLNIELLPSYITEFEHKSKWVLPSKLIVDYDKSPQVITPEDVDEADTDKKEPEDLYRKRYQWQFKDLSYSTDMEIRPAVYQKFKELKRVDYTYWADEYVAGGMCGEVRTLAQNLMQLGKPENTFEEVEFVLAFTQDIVKYEHDAEYYPNAIRDGEYPKYPVETLAEETGDCEDSAILAAALLKSMGYDSALIYLPGHCALGIAGVDGMPGTAVKLNNVSYYYCETTATGWEIGKLPPSYNEKDVKVLPVPNIKISLDV